MNKHFVFALGLAATLAWSSCSDEEPVNKPSALMAQLPEKAQQFVRTTFNSGTIVEVDRDLDNALRQRGSLYEATLRVNGVEIDIEFDQKGNWINIEADNNQAIPAAAFSLISDFPKHILTYIAGQHKGMGINEVEQKAYGTEVELVNGQKLLFDKSGAFLNGSQTGSTPPSPNMPEALPENVSALVEKHFAGYTVVYHKPTQEDGVNVTKYYIQKKGSYYEGYKLVFDAARRLIEVEGDDDPMLPVSLDVVRLFSPQAADNIAAKYADYYVTEVELKGQRVKIELEHRTSDRELTLNFPLNGSQGDNGGGGTVTPNPSEVTPATVEAYLATYFPGFLLAQRYAEQEDGMQVTKYVVRNERGLEYKLVYNTAGQLVEVEGDDSPLAEIPTSVLNTFSPNLSQQAKNAYPDYAIVEVKRTATGFKLELEHRITKRDLTLHTDANGVIANGGGSNVTPPTPGNQLPAEVQSYIKVHFPQYQFAQQQTEKEDGVSVTKYILRNAQGLEYKLVYNLAGQLVEVEGDDSPLAELPKSVLNTFSPNLAPQLATNYSAYAVVEVKRTANGFKLELEHRTTKRDLTLHADANGTLLNAGGGSVVPPATGTDIPTKVRSYIDTHFPQFRLFKRNSEQEDGQTVTKYTLRNALGLEYKLVYNTAGQLIEVEGDDSPLAEIPTSVLNTFSPRLAPQIAANYSAYAVVEVKRTARGFKLDLQHRTSDKDIDLYFDLQGQIVRR